MGQRDFVLHCWGKFVDSFDGRISGKVVEVRDVLRILREFN